MAHLSKRMKQAYEGIDKAAPVPLPEAIGRLHKAPRVKFDETVEVCLKLTADPKQADQTLRGTVVLPHGTGKTVRVIVFCKGEVQQKAKDAGADLVGAEDLIAKVEKGWMEFDVAIATPEMMRDLSKLGKVLGPRGLMPSPKAGTVTQDVVSALKEVRAGRTEFRMDKTGNMNAGVGKISFSEQSLVENVLQFVTAVQRAKPAGVKGALIKSMAVSTTMGPGVPVALSSLPAESGVA